MSAVSMRNGRDALWGLLACLCCIGITPPTAAEGDAPPTIETEGSATITVAPDHVDFWLHKRISATSTTEAATQVRRFEPDLREQLKAHELEPSEVMISGTAIPDMDANEVQASARLRFTATKFADPKEGGIQFATLCDKVRALADAMNIPRGFREGPFLGVADPGARERAVIVRAVEKAYPAAEAVAGAMRAHVVQVSSVRVEEVVWNQDPEWKGFRPDNRFLICTARVRVSYTFAAGAT